MLAVFKDTHRDQRVTVTVALYMQTCRKEMDACRMTHLVEFLRNGYVSACQ